MSAQKYAVALRQKVEQKDLAEVVKSLVVQLGVKEKTAHQILQHIPLKVYSQLSFGEARILVEALNVVTRCQWELMLESEVNFPAANWNKRPTVMGLRLDELMLKNDPKVTGVARYLETETVDLPGISDLSQNLNKENLADQNEEFLEESILDSADTVLKNLSADLDRVLDKDGGPELMQTQVLSAMAGEIKKTDLSSESLLESGFYNLYLPELNKKEKELVFEIARESLGMDASTLKGILSKSIPCICRNVDEKEAHRLIELFKKEGIQLKNRLRSKA